MSITADQQPSLADLPPAVANAIRRANRSPLGDTPLDIASNLAPATIEVTSNLAEDTVIGGVMDIAPGDNQVAMFANPFSGGSEEMLYIDERSTLRWARHVNAVNDADPGGQAGWSIDPVAEHAGEVVVAVGIDGAVWAIMTSIGKGSQGTVYQLVADPTAEGGQRWKWVQTLNLPTFSADTFHILPVYYCTDRLATPVVFIDVPHRTQLFWLMLSAPAKLGDEPKAPWRSNSFTYDAADADATKVAGIDSPNVEFSQGAVVSLVRMWSLVGQRLYCTDYYPHTTTRERRMVGGENYAKILGPWAAPNHAGVICLLNERGNHQIELSRPTELMVSKFRWNYLHPDCVLDDVRVWQDAEGLVHLYGRDSSGTLKVAHQTGWVDASAKYQDLPPEVMLDPVFESHFLAEIQADVLTSRALIGSVATFALDAYPDDMPSQHVMHQGAAPGETCAIYSQDLRTTLWHQERMRLVPEKLPKPYVVPRYEATLTVKNALGAPVTNCPISLNAEAPVDLEVAGRFYRTGTITPVRLLTDGNGQVTLRVVARSLAVPQLHVTAPGMAQSVTVQVAADVHKFLAGNGSLPNHPDGFTAEVVQTATKADGTLLFPGVRKDPGAGEWPPSAQDVVTWCQGVFALDSGDPLPAGMRKGLGDDEDVVAFTFQTHDPDRPGLQAFGTREQVAAHRQLLRDQGVFEEIANWFGDIWQGIQEGIVELAEITVNLWDQTVELLVTLADEVKAVFVCAWQDVVSAVHAVEAVFVAIGAKIQEVVNWLKWAFGFADVLRTAKAFRTAMDQAPRLVTSVVTEIGTVVDGFFIEKEAEVRSFFDRMKSALQGQSMASLQGPTATVPSDSQPNAQVAAVGDQAQSPHTQWFVQQVSRMGSSASTSAPQSGDGQAAGPIGDLINDVFSMFGDAQSFNTLSTAFMDLSDAFGEFFSGKDPGSVAASQLVDILDFAENVVVGILQLLDELANDVLGWSKEALQHISTVLDTSLSDVEFLKTIWDFVVEQSGLPAADYPLTIGMLGAVFAAYPFTLVAKAVTGKAPFADGGIPMPPVLGEPWHVDQELTGGLLQFQAFQGLIQTLDAILDGWINLDAISGGAFPMPAGVVRGFAVAHFVAYVIGDYPWFWGYEPFAENPLPYLRYVLTFFFNLYDLFLAFDNKTIAAMFEGAGDGITPEERERRETVLMLATTAFGWIRIGINVAEYLTIPNRSEGEQATWFDTWNLWVNITAYIQTATGFVRFVYKRTEPDTPPFYIAAVALVVKTALDIAGDLYSGVSTIVQPYQEVFSPAHIDSDAGFSFAELWQPYESEVITASGGWPSYSWSLWTSTTSGQEFALPEGLSLVRPNFEKDLGRTVQIVGTPAELFAAPSFILRVDDGYGPSAFDVKDCQLRVYGAPPGIPVADFSFTPNDPQAPARVQFTQTSSGAPTSWQWTLDNGQPIDAEENPLVDFTVADTYQVKLVAINQHGWSAPVTKALVVAAPPGTPVADFSVPDKLRANTTIQFTDKSTGGPVSYLWDFGDGRTSTERNPIHIYDKGGSYVLSLVCSNANGQGVRHRETIAVSWR